MSKTIANELAAYCTDLSLSAVDAETVDYTKKLLLDTLGTTIGGYDWSDSADVVVETSRTLHGDSGAGDATVLATGERFTSANAALANGTLSHSLDYDTRHSPGSLHIGSSVVPAALAAAEQVDADGVKFLEAIIAGYDVAARLGMACNPRSSHERGFHPTGACGTFAATAAVGVVRGLDAETLHTAFGVNGSQAAGGYQCSISGGWNKRIHPGLAAKRAFVAIAYAVTGFEAPPDPIEGDLGFLQAYADRPRPERATAGLGEVYEAARTKIKPYPVGTFAHVPIALLIEIVTERGIEPGEIDGIVVEIPHSGAAMFGRDDGDDNPTTSAGAQFDMPFAAALATTAREAGLGAFDEAVTGGYDDEFRRLMEITDTVGSDELEEYLPELYPARVTVQTTDGTFERFREWVEGEPEHPMPWTDLEAKFADLTPRFDAADREAIVEGTRSIETRTVTELVETVCAAIECASEKERET